MNIKIFTKNEGGGSLRWGVVKDYSTFFQSKEYIDTVFVPIIPVSFDKNGEAEANASEFIQLIATEVERQFRGRILLLPPLVYFTTYTVNDRQEIITRWINNIIKEKFNHIFFISSNSAWTNIIENIGGNHIWIPTIPLEYVDEKNKKRLIEKQANQIFDFFITEWQKAEKLNN